MYWCCAQINMFSGLISVWMIRQVSCRYLRPCSTYRKYYIMYYTNLKRLRTLAVTDWPSGTVGVKVAKNGINLNAICHLVKDFLIEENSGNDIWRVVSGSLLLWVSRFLTFQNGVTDVLIWMIQTRKESSRYFHGFLERYHLETFDKGLFGVGNFVIQQSNNYLITSVWYARCFFNNYSVGQSIKLK